jgi:hypothetical protein
MAFSRCRGGFEDISTGARDESRSYVPEASGEGSLISAATSISFIRPDRPERSVTARFGTRSHSATARITAVLAAPRAGGSRTHRYRVFPSHARRTAVAFGYTRTATVVMLELERRQPIPSVELGALRCHDCLHSSQRGLKDMP